MLCSTVLVVTTLVITGIQGLSIHLDIVIEGPYTFPPGDIYITSGYLSLWNNTLSSTSGAIQSSGGFYITTDDALSFEVSIDSTYYALDNYGVFSFVSSNIKTSSTFKLFGSSSESSFINRPSGAIFLVNKESDGPMFSSIKLIGWENLGKITFYKDSAPAGVTTLGVTSIQNDGDMYFYNQIYNQSTHIKGNGCIHIQTGSTVFIKYPAAAVENTLFMEDPTALLYIATVPSSQIFAVSGFGGGNRISFIDASEDNIGVAHYDYDGLSGILTIYAGYNTSTLNYTSPHNLDIGTGYIESNFQISSSGITYIDTVPNSVLPPNCRPAPPVPVAPKLSAYSSAASSSTPFSNTIISSSAAISSSILASSSSFSSSSTTSSSSSAGSSSIAAPSNTLSSSIALSSSKSISPSILTMSTSTISSIVLTSSSPAISSSVEILSSVPVSSSIPMSSNSENSSSAVLLSSTAISPSIALLSNLALSSNFGISSGVVFSSTFENSSSVQSPSVLSSSNTATATSTTSSTTVTQISSSFVISITSLSPEISSSVHHESSSQVLSSSKPSSSLLSVFASSNAATTLSFQSSSLESSSNAHSSSISQAESKSLMSSLPGVSSIVGTSSVYNSSNTPSSKSLIASSVSFSLKLLSSTSVTSSPISSSLLKSTSSINYPKSSNIGPLSNNSTTTTTVGTTSTITVTECPVCTKYLSSITTTVNGKVTTKTIGVAVTTNINGGTYTTSSTLANNECFLSKIIEEHTTICFTTLPGGLLETLTVYVVIGTNSKGSTSTTSVLVRSKAIEGQISSYTTTYILTSANSELTKSARVVVATNSAGITYSTTMPAVITDILTNNHATAAPVPTRASTPSIGASSSSPVTFSENGSRKENPKVVIVSIIVLVLTPLLF